MKTYSKLVFWNLGSLFFLLWSIGQSLFSSLIQSSLHQLCPRSSNFPTYVTLTVEEPSALGPSVACFRRDVSFEIMCFIYTFGPFCTLLHRRCAFIIVENISHIFQHICHSRRIWFYPMISYNSWNEDACSWGIKWRNGD